MSEREGVKIRRYDACEMDYIAERESGDYVKYEDHMAALATAERERDEARREREAMRIDHADALDAYRQMYESERERAERAEAEAAYIRRAFRGAVESDALAVTYKTVGSYRAGLLKTINALDTAEAP